MLGNLIDVAGNRRTGCALFAQCSRYFLNGVHGTLGRHLNLRHRLTGQFGFLDTAGHSRVAGRHVLLGFLHATAYGGQGFRDFHCRLARPFGQLAHLVGNNRKAATVFAGPRRFDGRVERQQIGLIGNLADHVDDPGDMLGLAGQTPDRLGRQADDIGNLLHFTHRGLHRRQTIAGNFRCLVGRHADPVGIAGNLLDGNGHLLHGGSDARCRLTAAQRALLQLPGNRQEGGG